MRPVPPPRNGPQSAALPATPPCCPPTSYHGQDELTSSRAVLERVQDQPGPRLWLCGKTENFKVEGEWSIRELSFVSRFSLCVSTFAEPFLTLAFRLTCSEAHATNGGPSPPQGQVAQTTLSQLVNRKAPSALRHSFGRPLAVCIEACTKRCGLQGGSQISGHGAVPAIVGGYSHARGRMGPCRGPPGRPIPPRDRRPRAPGRPSAPACPRAVRERPGAGGCRRGSTQ